MQKGWKEVKELIVDNELKSVIPPLTDDEFKRLESSCIEEGIRDPIVTWNGIIVDGHNRYEIARKHNLKFNEKKKDFADRWDAIAWMCANQMSRRNLNDIQRTMLIGKEYEARKKSRGGNTGTEHSDNGRFTATSENRNLRLNTRDIVAKEHGIAGSTVSDASYFVKGIETADEVSPGFKESVISGKIKVPKKEVMALRKIEDKQELKETVETIKKPKTRKDVPKVRSKAVDAAIESLKPENIILESDSERAESIRKELTAMFNDFVKRFKTFTEIHNDFDSGELRSESNKLYDQIDYIIGQIENKQGF